MAEKRKYVALHLPEDIMEEFKVWKQAYSRAAMRQVSYAEILRGLFDNIEQTEPDVVAELDRMIKARPELLNKMGNNYGKQEQ